MDRCLELHKIFNGMKRYNANNIDEIPFNNGVYIFFEKGEKYHGMDRIVRVGTDTGQNNLRRRIKQHLLGSNKDHSVFRKNIGRAFLNKKGNYELLQYWNLSLTRRENKLKYFDSIILNAFSTNPTKGSERRLYIKSLLKSLASSFSFSSEFKNSKNFAI